MKTSSLRAVLGCLALSVSALPAADARIADFSQLSQWIVEAAPGIDLKQDAGTAALKVTRVTEGKPRATSDQEKGIYNSAPGRVEKARAVSLRLKRRPVLPENAARAGMWIFVERPIAVDGLWLTFVDAKGHEFEYRLPSPQSWQRGWQYLDTFPFDANERGKLHPDVGRMLGGLTGLPEKPIKLSGLRLEVRNDAEGRWLLGAVESDFHRLGDRLYHWGLNIPGDNPRTTQTLLRSNESPYLPAGKILPAGGEADVSWEIRDGYQGEPIGQGGRNLAFRGGDVQAMAERLPLGDLPGGDYEIAVTVRQEGKKIQQRQFALSVLDSPVPDATRKPTRSTAEPGESLQIPLASWHSEPGDKKWRIEDATGNVVGAGALNNEPVTWAPPAPGIYRYVAERMVDGRVVDRDTRLLGGRVPVKDLGPAEFSARDAAPTEQDLFGPGRNYFTWAMYENHPEDVRYWDWCRQWIADGRKAGFDLFRLRLDWGKIEKLPGVFDFELTDRLIAEVARQCGRSVLELRFETPEWLPVSHQLDSYGRADIWNHDRIGRIPSIWTPGMLSSLTSFVRACVLRYRNNPEVAGYHIWGLPGSLDWTVVDKPYLGQRVDYSEVAQEEFRKWSGNKYASAPLTSEDWNSPDLSEGWKDWIAFRSHGLDAFFIDSVLKPLRELDDRRSVVAYFGLDYASRDLARSARELNWRRHTGGSELYYQTPLKSSMAVMDTGKTWPQEVHLLTPLPAGLELATFNISAPGGDAFHWNYYWRNNIPVGQWTAEREQGLKEWQTLWRPLWQELRDARTADAPDIAALMTWSTMQYGLRTFFPLRLGDYVTPTAAALYRDGLWPEWFTENAPLDNLAKYRMIVVPAGAAQVMPARMADALARYVEEGGRVVLFPDSGKWVIEEKGKPYGLLRRVGGAQLAQNLPVGGEMLDAGNSGLPATNIPEPQNVTRASGSALFTAQTPLRLRPGLAINGLPADAVEARFSDGSPAVTRWSFGKGEVILFAGVPDWAGSPGLWRDLYAWSGGRRRVVIDRPDVEANHLVKGESHYIIIHRLTDSFRPQPPVLDREQLRKQPPVTATWRLDGIPDGRWQVTETSSDGQKTYSLSTRELSEGIKTDLFLAQTKVFKLEPIPQ